jgi:chromosome segregation ATPase
VKATRTQVEGLRSNHESLSDKVNASSTQQKLLQDALERERNEYSSRFKKFRKVGEDKHNAKSGYASLKKKHARLEGQCKDSESNIYSLQRNLAVHHWQSNQRVRKEAASESKITELEGMLKKSTEEYDAVRKGSSSLVADNRKLELELATLETRYEALERRHAALKRDVQASNPYNFQPPAVHYPSEPSESHKPLSILPS